MEKFCSSGGYSISARISVAGCVLQLYKVCSGAFRDIIERNLATVTDHSSTTHCQPTRSSCPDKMRSLLICLVALLLASAPTHVSALVLEFRSFWIGPSFLDCQGHHQLRLGRLRLAATEILYGTAVRAFKVFISLKHGTLRKSYQSAGARSVPPCCLLIDVHDYLRLGKASKANRIVY